MSATDFYGSPEYFVSCVTTESAGNGNIRVFNYVSRGGQLVPQFSCVLAAADLIKASREVETAAHDVFNAMMDGVVH